MQAADTIERVVAGIRDKTAVPLTTVARALVFGLLATVMGAAALIFVVIALIRLVDVYVVDGEVWAAYLGLGGIFTVAGAFLLRRATSATSSKGTRST